MPTSQLPHLVRSSFPRRKGRIQAAERDHCQGRAGLDIGIVHLADDLGRLDGQRHPG